jgi:DNA-binding response OmpR family regulator
MSAATILVVEGKRAGDDSLVPSLEKEGYVVACFYTGTSALAWSRGNAPDLIIFDAASMRSSGVRSCRQLRKENQETPIIHTRQDGHPKDTSAGADIYLMKPFTPRKVLNRVRALLPADQFKEEIVRAGKLTLFRSKPSVDIDGRGEKRLTPKQARLLEEFLRYPNQILTRRQLMRDVWQTDYIGDTRTLDVHIRWVREAVEDDPADPKRIATVRGVGYVFRLPPEERVKPSSR